MVGLFCLQTNKMATGGGPRNEKKITEGKENILEAEKCLKTGLLKWKPDYEGAAVEYGKAAVAFKNGKANDLAIDSYMKQAEMLQKTGSNYTDFHAAKALESAAMIQRDEGKYADAADLIERAANMFLEHGTPSSAAVMLDKAGKMLEQHLPERSVKLYLKACDVSDAEERVKECAEMVGKAARVLIRLKRYNEAADALQREIEFYNKAGNTDMFSKLVFGLVLVHLHTGDSVAADQAFKKCLSYSDFGATDEAAAIQRLLEAYDEGDDERVEQIAKSPLFKFMENDFTKLARDLKVPEGLKISSSRSSGPAGEDVTVAASAAPQLDDDDDDNGLL